MQSATSMHSVSYGKNLRAGHHQIVDALQTHNDRLNVKLPTGYGKTFGCALAYATLQRLGRANRLLVIFPSDTQLKQFIKDGPQELADARVSGAYAIMDIRFFAAEAIRTHRQNRCQIFVITVQALGQSRGANNCHDLMGSGDWMVVVDEYHHYGVEKMWGKAALALPQKFILAMSATPTRRQRDSAFGVPDVSIGYRAAVEENVVKPMRGHAYRYRLDAVDKEGNVESFTLDQLVSAVGSDDPKKVEAFRIERGMRWSPKYISPLVSIPIERMQHDRISSGWTLQTLITAMCVSHAKMVCEQIRTMYPELRVEWVGTGDDGRPEVENETILKQFCPPKDANGIRKPTLDVLVNVGLAGEGLDSVNVSEVILLTNGTICNSNNQIIGRASRYLPDVTANVNFDHSSEYASKGYVGRTIEDALDEEPPSEDLQNPGDNNGDWDPLPEEPRIRLFDIEFIGVDSGAPDVQRMARVMVQTGHGDLDYASLMQNLDDPAWDQVVDAYKNMRRAEAKAFDPQSEIEQWKEQVNRALSVVAGRAMRLMTKIGRAERSLPGDIKKRINQQKYWAIGGVTPDKDVYKKHYRWLCELEAEILRDGVPAWLQ